MTWLQFSSTSNRTSSLMIADDILSASLLSSGMGLLKYKAINRIKGRKALLVMMTGRMDSIWNTNVRRCMYANKKSRVPVNTPFSERMARADVAKKCNSLSRWDRHSQIKASTPPFCTSLARSWSEKKLGRVNTNDSFSERRLEFPTYHYLSRRLPKDLSLHGSVRTDITRGQTMTKRWCQAVHKPLPAWLTHDPHQ